MKKRYLPVRDVEDVRKVELVEVEDTEEYREIIREINRQRKKNQGRGKCSCPKKYIWKCDLDCGLCEFMTAGKELSLDYQISNEEGKEQSLLDKLTDKSESLEDGLIRKDMILELIEALKECNEEEQSMLQMLSEGKSERDIAKELGIAQTTLNYRKKKLFSKIKEKLSFKSLDNLQW